MRCFSVDGPRAVSLPLVDIACCGGGARRSRQFAVVGCSTLHIGMRQFLRKYPKAPAACQEARVTRARIREVQCKVYLVNPDTVTLTFLNVAGR